MLILVPQEANMAVVDQLQASELTLRRPGRSLNSRPVSWEQGKGLELGQARLQCSLSCWCCCWCLRLGILGQAWSSQTMPSYRRVTRLGLKDSRPPQERDKGNGDSRETGEKKGLAKEATYVAEPSARGSPFPAHFRPVFDGGIHRCRQWWHHIHIWRSMGLYVAQLLKRSRRSVLEFTYWIPLLDCAAIGQCSL